MKGNAPASPAAAAAGPSGSGEACFALNPALDAMALRDRFAARGRVHIPDFLAADGAARLLAHLRERPDWILVINQDDKLFELDRSAQAALTEAQKAQLDAAVHRSARRGFQYRYETVRVPDSAAKRAAEPTLLTRFADFLAEPATLAFLRTVTGADAIGFADAQATAYSPGHFLTAHDDNVAGKDRAAAYVMNLSAEWRADWGGLLMFEGGDGHIEEAYVPRFNALNLFAVPAPHSVSYVAPFAPWRRYSVTGWLRAIAPPA
ncbi:2OG-Fe(II) oxygenase family protein [Sphingosinicella sp. CPCC 101087]|uniref:2OG-Fe(II) oxygenase n=1 Tax=Sphingosinicella sp. CPCC 101087 TaxID=2497754 RepID=UPI00101DD5AD|nr:2OG-Fe(II) oxygenase family protein [Sphingosinicella sp. CPCC 101087]